MSQKRGTTAEFQVYGLDQYGQLKVETISYTRPTRWQSFVRWARRILGLSGWCRISSIEEIR